MDRHLSPRKTPLAREWLDARDHRLDRARRALLITVDGRRSGHELTALAQGLGLGQEAIADLHRQGLIVWPTVIVAPVPPPPPPPPPKPAAPQPSLAAAKMYAIDLATLMLGGRDQDLRALATEVQTREALVAWCEMAARAVETHAGPERAQRFLEKTSGMLAPSA